MALNQHRSFLPILLVAMTAMLHLPPSTNAAYTLSVRAYRYRNSRHKGSDGNCCDTVGSSNCGWCSHCECENRFKFCMREYGASRDGNEDRCPLGAYSTGVIGDDSFSFGWSQIDDDVPNPMTFSGDVWQGGFQLLVSIYDDDDYSADDHIDDVYVEGEVSPGGSISNREYIGHRSNAHINMSISLTCDTNYYGTDCTTYCVATNSNLGHYTCDRVTGRIICDTGWSNPDGNCLTPVCAANCHVVSGYCTSPGECRCRSGWSGRLCDQCEPRPGCSSLGGNCTVPGECVCRDGYSGALCGVDMIPCQRGSPCSNGALCTNNGIGGYVCHCTPGWIGTECEQDINDCASSPCQYRNCTDLVGGYMCACEPGWTGMDCGQDINECDPIPCQNGATCIDLFNSYNCSCLAGFFGPHCENEHDECAPRPCLNRGICEDHVDGYTCNCTDDFTGINCETNLSMCGSNLCQNGGTCISHNDGYGCLCAPGFTDHNCTSQIETHGLTSDSDDGFMKYVTWAAPTGGVLLLIVIVAMVIIALYYRRRRVPILSPPHSPVDDRMGTAKKLEGVCPSAEFEDTINPAYGVLLSEPPVYESVDDYAVPSRVPPPQKFPSEKYPPEDKCTVIYHEIQACQYTANAGQ